MIEILQTLNNLNEVKQLSEIKEIQQKIESGNILKVEKPDINFIEKTPYSVLMENNKIIEDKYEGLSENQKLGIKSETGWNDKIIGEIKNISQYEILKNADLKEVIIDDRQYLMKNNIDLDYIDRDGISNRDRILRGLSPIDASTEKPIELHHLGQKLDSPLVELTSEEHRTGEYEPGKKNHALWHSFNLDSEVHNGEYNWDQERKDYWQNRIQYC